MTDHSPASLPSLDLCPLPEGVSPVVCIIGYYGNINQMNCSNYQEMIRVVEEIVVEDWHLDLKEVVWASTASTWVAHLPCSLWQKHANGDARKGLLVLPTGLRELQKGLQSQVAVVPESVRQLCGSHQAMTRRLRETRDGNREIRDTRYELTDMITAGCEVISSESRNEQVNSLAERVHFLIYMPLEDGDYDRRHHSDVYNAAECPKRIVPLTQFLRS